MSDFRWGLIVPQDDQRLHTAPDPTGIHVPVPHNRIFSLVTEEFSLQGAEVSNVTHNISSCGSRYLGSFDLSFPHSHLATPSDYTLMGAVINSHDKSIATRFLLGNRVWICSNGSYFADHILSRKHTTHINRDLPNAVELLATRMHRMVRSQNETINTLKSIPLNESHQVHDFVIRSLDEKIISSSQISQVLSYWREPLHSQFIPRTAWSLVNAFTSAFQSRGPDFNPFTLGDRTPRLYRLALAVLSPEAPEDPSSPEEPEPLTPDLVREEYHVDTSNME